MGKFSQKATLIVSREDSGDMLAFYKFKLLVVEGPEAGREHLIEKEIVTVGSSRGCDVVVEDETVSRRHFEIRVTEEGHLIRDLGSTNGTEVDGCRIREAYLHAGARIRIGEALLTFQPLREKVEIPLSSSNCFGRMLGKSARMRALFHLAERVAGRDTTVLITGETGTGKGLLADEMHQHSPRAAHPLQVVDCATIPAHLMETELFGHVKGAFTGAVENRTGAFVEADGGTLLLDEIGELPAPLQPKLLRVLEKREVKPVGTTDTVRVNVRIIAATNRDLRAEVEAGRFREDLFFRLSVFELRVPPLRERKEDIAFLAREFLQQISQDPDRRFSDNAIRFLEAHDYPGNVRELRNVVERVVHLVDEKIIGQVSLMSTSITGVGPAPVLPSNRGHLSFAQAKEVAEKEYLLDLLRQHACNVSAAAKTAEIHRQSLHRLLRKHGIKAGDQEISGESNPAEKSQA